MGAVAAAAGVLVFLLTQNMNNLMVIIDAWTPLMLVLFVAEVVCFVIARKIKRQDDPNGDEPDNSPTQELYNTTD